jgi:hypothetical protein
MRQPHRSGKQFSGWFLHFGGLQAMECRHTRSFSDQTTDWCRQIGSPESPLPDHLTHLIHARFQFRSQMYRTREPATHSRVKGPLPKASPGRCSRQERATQPYGRDPVLDPPDIDVHNPGHSCRLFVDHRLELHAVGIGLARCELVTKWNRLGGIGGERGTQPRKTDLRIGQHGKRVEWALNRLACGIPDLNLFSIRAFHLM